MQVNEENKSKEYLGDISGWNCMYVPVSDVYKSVQWYQTNLGYIPTKNNPVRLGMKHAIMRFPDHEGKTQGPGLTNPVPALFLVEAEGRLGFINHSGNITPIGSLVTPRIQVMFNRFKENGVNIVNEIPEGRECGPNVHFYDPDGNLWEIWQPPFI